MTGHYHRLVANSVILLIIVVGLSLGRPAASDAAEVRIWTDSSGQYTIKGKLLRVESGRAVLEQEDGTKVRIDLKKLSEADQKHLQQNDTANPFQPVEGSAGSVSEGPSRPSNRSSECRQLTVDWSSAREITMAPASRWELPVPEAVQAVPAPARSLALPAKRDFMDRLKGFAVSAVSPRAVLGYVWDRGPRDSQTRVVLCDLEGGRVCSGTAPEPMVPLALSDNGVQVLMRSNEFGFGKQDRLELWVFTSSGVQRAQQWFPYDQAKRLDRDVKWGTFLPNGQMATLSGHGRLAVWTLDPLRPLYYLPIDRMCTPAISPDRKYLAFVGNSNVGILDLQAGQVVAVQRLGIIPSSYLAFSPSGARLACGGMSRLYVLSVAKGELLREILLTDSPAHDHMVWTSESHVLVGNRTLFDAANQVKVWRYEGVEGSVYRNGVCWLLVAADHNKPGTLLSLKLPQPGVEEMVERAIQQAEFYVLRPGVTVRVVVDGLPEVAEREKARAVLTEKLQANGFAVGPGGTIDLVASTEVGQEIPVTYHVQSLPGGFSTHGSHTFKLKPQLVRLRFVYQGQTVWSVASTGMSTEVKLEPGKTIQQQLEQHQKPNYGWLQTVELPKVVTKTTSEGTLGHSRLTSSGLQDLPVSP